MRVSVCFRRREVQVQDATAEPDGMEPAVMLAQDAMRVRGATAEPDGCSEPVQCGSG